MMAVTLSRTVPLWEMPCCLEAHHARPAAYGNRPRRAETRFKPRSSQLRLAAAALTPPTAETKTLLPYITTWHTKVDVSFEPSCTLLLSPTSQDTLPANEKYPSCYLGGHLWLDKGLVSTKVKMHPMLLRACWIESPTRNGCGNGGAYLGGQISTSTEGAVTCHCRFE